MRGRPTAAAAAALLVAVANPVSPRALAHDRDVLWRIVHEQCVPGQQRTGDPAPCTAVDLSAGEDRGYAVLKDSDGDEQYLLIPTARVTGIEDPALRAPGAPNYFADAWRARAFTEAGAGGVLPRDWISLAVNSAVARTQDQLHIHIDCLSAEAHRALSAAPVGPVWSPLPVPLAGERYEAIAVADLDAVNPFALAADSSDVALSTVVVVGAGTDEHPGFVLLRRHAEPGSGDQPAGEDLQDHDACPAPVPAGPFTGK